MKNDVGSRVGSGSGPVVKRYGSGDPDPHHGSPTAVLYTVWIRSVQWVSDHGISNTMLYNELFLHCNSFRLNLC